MKAKAARKTASPSVAAPAARAKRNAHCESVWPECMADYARESGAPNQRLLSNWARATAAQSGMSVVARMLRRDEEIRAEKIRAEAELMPFDPITREGLWLALITCSHVLDCTLDDVERIAYQEVPA